MTSSNETSRTSRLEESLVNNMSNGNQTSPTEVRRHAQSVSSPSMNDLIEAHQAKGRQISRPCDRRSSSTTAES